MKIKCLIIGKTDDRYIADRLSYYIKRLPSYVQFKLVELPDLKQRKKLSVEEQKKKEGERILAQVDAKDQLFLLDEKGKQNTSVAFSKWLERKGEQGTPIVFVIGGPYGFSKEVYDRCDAKIALSSMTFTHQMVRLFFIEQIYRSFTILQGKPYHHDG